MFYVKNYVDGKAIAVAPTDSHTPINRVTVGPDGSATFTT